MLTSNNTTQSEDPYDVPIHLAIESKGISLFTPSKGMARRLYTGKTFYFMFVRNPYTRVLSAYIDKLVAPNPYYWKQFGVKAIAKYRVTSSPQSYDNETTLIKYKKEKHNEERGHDVTFTEFLKWVVQCENTLSMPDPHIASVMKICKPCSSNISFVGKMESFEDDAFFVMNKLEMNKSTQSLEKTFKNKTIDDAIIDSIVSPFQWNQQIVQQISWASALQRIWLKLQLRGIIDFDQKLNLTPHQVVALTQQEFIDMAREAHKRAEPRRLRKQKAEVTAEAFRRVPLTDLEAFKKTFMEDFILFGYESTPEVYFNRDNEFKTPLKYFNPDILK